MPCKGIDITLTSCFTGFAISPAQLPRRDLYFSAWFPFVRESPIGNQDQPDIRNIQ
ncbi:hypothetical protein EMIT051CA3_30054 [Pseudomonas chlororaphis]